MSDDDSDETEVFHTRIAPNSTRTERPEYLDKVLFQSQFTVSLKAQFLTLKNFVLREIDTIKEKLSISTHPNNEHTHCQVQIKYLREENISKNLIIKIPSENQSAFKECLPQQSTHQILFSN